MQTPTSETPTVEPLRISKHDFPTPPNAENGYSFPPPPAASSAHGSLPYPDDAPSQSPSANRTATPDRDHEQSAAQPSSSTLQSKRPNDSGKYVPYHGGSSGGNASGAKPSTVADRRQNAAKPLPDSPGPELPDKEGLFAKPPAQASPPPDAVDADPYTAYHQQYYPPPGAASSSGPSTSTSTGGLAAPKPSAVNRLSSTASTSTTKAQRGSPPPPETPVLPGGGAPVEDIAARYAAAGIAGTATLTSLQAQNAAAAQRANQYPQPSSRLAPAGASQDPTQRPWTPTELPGSQPFGPPTVYQGPGEAPGAPPGRAGAGAGAGGAGAAAAGAAQPPSGSGQTQLEQDFHRMQLSASPPPAYSSVQPGRGANTGEKASPAALPAAATAAATVAATSSPSNDQAGHAAHPAFANDPRPGASPEPGQGQPASTAEVAGPVAVAPDAGPASPPPLPEGWIAHLDQNSGQYYYIHLPTQSTQWEFPKGPTPLNLNEPSSPTASNYGAHSLASPGLSAFGGKPMASPGLASPGFPPMTPGYPESILSMSVGSASTTGFTGPPPSAGVDIYKVAPTNGVYFGPYLRYTNMDLEQGLWLGSVLLVTDAPQPPTIHIHQSSDLSPNRTI